MNYRSWNDFVEAKANPDTPPQGKGAKSYYGPNVKRGDKVKLHVAEKNGKGLGDEATPALKDAKLNIPSGERPSYKGLVQEQKRTKDEYDGKPRIRVTEKGGKGLGDESGPSAKDVKKNLPGGLKPSYKHLTTEEFLNKTRLMSDSEFVDAMLGEGRHDSDSPEDDEDDEEEDALPSLHCQYSGRKVMPSSFEVSRYMANMMPQNERAVRMFVNEMKSVPGSMAALMSEMVGHNELYGEMVNQIGLGETKVARRFVKAMQESHDKFMSELGLSEAVGPPMGDRSVPPKHTGPPPVDNGGDMGMGMGMGGGSDPAMGMPAGGDPSQGDAMMSEPSVDDTNGEPSYVEPVGGEDESPQMQLNKEFAYHHMIREMNKYNNMQSVMREMLDG